MNGSFQFLEFQFQFLALTGIRVLEELDYQISNEA